MKRYEFHGGARGAKLKNAANSRATRFSRRVHSSRSSPISLVANTAQRRKSTDKTGSVFSRGTLVVCPVSLVGQWVEEAKNKLTDPGMVYPYYGGQRKRDPSILSQKDIVVTTYAVLASDNNYWRKNSKDENYCAPCQKIR